MQFMFAYLQYRHAIVHRRGNRHRPHAASTDSVSPQQSGGGAALTPGQRASIGTGMGKKGGQPKIDPPYVTASVPSRV